jgi:hypothetical protein
MATRRAHQAARRHPLLPAVALPPVPEPVLRSQAPLSALCVLHPELTHRGPEGTVVKGSCATLGDQLLVTLLGLTERINRHLRQI